MGFAKYQEDLVSRHVRDNLPTGVDSEAVIGTDRKVVKSTDPKEEQKGQSMTTIKDFTLQAARPLPVILLADVSGSMSSDGKIQALNHAIREMIEAFQDEGDLRAEIHLAVITFGGKSQIHLSPTSAPSVSWVDLSAQGATPMGAAFDLAHSMIEDKALIPGRAYRPTVVLLSDGQPTDQWQPALTALLGGERSGKALRMALAIGSDADKGVLQAFLGDASARVYQADEARQIRKFFQLVTMSVAARSRSANPNTTPAPQDDGWDL